MWCAFFSNFLVSQKPLNIKTVVFVCKPFALYFLFMFSISPRFPVSTYKYVTFPTSSFCQHICQRSLFSSLPLYEYELGLHKSLSHLLTAPFHAFRRVIFLNSNKVSLTHCFLISHERPPSLGVEPSLNLQSTGMYFPFSHSNFYQVFLKLQRYCR